MNGTMPASDLEEKLRHIPPPDAPPKRYTLLEHLGYGSTVLLFFVALPIALIAYLFLPEQIHRDVERIVETWGTVVLATVAIVYGILWVLFHLFSVPLFFFGRAAGESVELYRAPLGRKILTIIVFFAIFAWWWFESLGDGLQGEEDLRGLFKPILVFLFYYFLRGIIWDVLMVLFIAPLFVFSFRRLFPERAARSKIVQWWERERQQLRRSFLPSRLRDKLLPGREAPLISFGWLWLLATITMIAASYLINPGLYRSPPEDPRLIALVVAAFVFWPLFAAGNLLVLFYIVRAIILQLKRKRQSL